MRAANWLWFCLALRSCIWVCSSNHAIFSTLISNQRNLSWSCFTVLLFVVGCWSSLSKSFSMQTDTFIFPRYSLSLFSHRNQSTSQRWVTIQLWGLTYLYLLFSLYPVKWCLRREKILWTAGEPSTTESVFIYSVTNRQVGLEKKFVCHYDGVLPNWNNMLLWLKIEFRGFCGKKI